MVRACLLSLALGMAAAVCQARVIYIPGAGFIDTRPSAPSMPTHASECEAHRQRLSDLTGYVDRLHDQCLKSNKGSHTPGPTCSVAACQDLHSARDEMFRDPSYASCMATVAERQREEADRRARTASRVVGEEVVNAARTAAVVVKKGVTGYASEKLQERAKEAARTYGTEDPDSNPTLNVVRQTNERAYGAGVTNSAIRELSKQSTDAAVAKQADALSKLNKALTNEVGTAQQLATPASAPKRTQKERESDFYFK